MLTFSKTYGRNYKFSQNSEEGILEEALRRMSISVGVSVEIGGNDGWFCANTALLAEQGWRSLFVEVDFSLYQQCVNNWAGYPNVRSQCSRVDERNINAFVHDDCDVLSIDVDGSDYKIFKGLKAKPKIVIIEIDSSIPPDSLEFNSDGAAGYASMVKLGIEKGYFLLCHTGNVVMVASEYAHLFPEINRNPLTDSASFFNRSWLKEEAA